MAQQWGDAHPIHGREMQIKTTLRYNFSPIRLAKSKHLTTHSIDKAMEKTGTLNISGKTQKMAQVL